MTSLRPLLASLLAFLWVIAPLASELHFLLVEHSVCSEHKELTEAGNHGREGVEQQDAHEHFEGPVISSTSVHTDGHDHGCGFLLPLSPKLGSEIALMVRPNALTFPSPELGDASGPRTPPLSFAPKTSPPRS